jgi:hypothetical protein
MASFTGSLFGSTDTTTSIDVDSVITQSDKDKESASDITSTSSHTKIDSSALLCNGGPSQFTSNVNSNNSKTSIENIVSSLGKNMNLTETTDSTTTTTMTSAVVEEPTFKKYNPITNERINPFDKDTTPVTKTVSPVPNREEKTLDDLTKDRFNRQQDREDNTDKILSSVSAITTSQSKREEFGKTRKSSSDAEIIFGDKGEDYFKSYGKYSSFSSGSGATAGSSSYHYTSYSSKDSTTSDSESIYTRKDDGKANPPYFKSLSVSSEKDASHRRWTSDDYDLK